ncbi:MAG: HAD family hydrolase, partial [Mycobacteriaceae bacterium]
VSTPWDVLRAGVGQRPDYIGADLGVLNRPASESAVAPVAGWSVETDGENLRLSCSVTDPRPVDALRAACTTAWANPSFTRVVAGDSQARDVLQQWGID